MRLLGTNPRKTLSGAIGRNEAAHTHRSLFCFPRLGPRRSYWHGPARTIRSLRVFQLCLIRTERCYANRHRPVGLCLAKWLRLGATANAGYRNYSLVTNEIFSIDFGHDLGSHDFRLGPIAGVYTLWLSRYSVTIPIYGTEAEYGYSLSPVFSLRVKERVFALHESGRQLISSSTLIGFCFTFGGPPIQ